MSTKLATVDWPAADERWETNKTISVFNIDDQYIANIPLEFLHKGGVATWRDLGDIMDLITNDTTGTPLMWKHRLSGKLVNVDERSEAGHFVCFRKGTVRPKSHFDFACHAVSLAHTAL
jgi:hypothetical protein